MRVFYVMIVIPHKGYHLEGRRESEEDTWRKKRIENHHLRKYIISAETLLGI
jgi:hypothetical protein